MEECRLWVIEPVEVDCMNVVDQVGQLLRYLGRFLLLAPVRLVLGPELRDEENLLA